LGIRRERKFLQAGGGSESRELPSKKIARNGREQQSSTSGALQAEYFIICKTRVSR